MGPKSDSVPHYFFRSSNGAILSNHVSKSESINQQEKRQPMNRPAFGRYDFFAKPFHHDQFLSAVRGALAVQQ
jgi:hypothetical protein